VEKVEAPALLPVVTDYTRSVVSAASISALLTVEEYKQIPEKPGGRWELHHGEAVFVPAARFRPRKLVQRRLRRLLEPIVDPLGYVADTEYGYKPFPEHEVWVADVAVVSVERENAIRDWLDGSPQLTIEIKSQSNTKSQLHDKAMTTLAGEGAVEFWAVDPKRQIVTAYNRKSGMQVYVATDAVPLSCFGGQRLCVSDLFAP
jgi:Uma2 family endonuclease